MDDAHRLLDLRRPKQFAILDRGDVRKPLSQPLSGQRATSTERDAFSTDSGDSRRKATSWRVFATLHHGVSVFLSGPPVESSSIQKFVFLRDVEFDSATRKRHQGEVDHHAPAEPAIHDFPACLRLVLFSSAQALPLALRVAGNPAAPLHGHNRSGSEPDHGTAQYRADADGWQRFFGTDPAGDPGRYGINQISFSGGIKGNGAGQTIAIVNAYNDPNIAADLATFDKTYNLPAPPSFDVDNLGAKTTDPGWALETALDVEWAHALAPGPRSSWSRPPAQHELALQCRHHREQPLGGQRDLDELGDQRVLWRVVQ